MEFVVSAIRSSGGSVISQDPESGQVFTNGMTFRTWGQFLKVDLRDTDLGEQMAVCTSWPTHDVVWEWGAGNIVINRFIDKLGEMTPEGRSLVQ